MGSRRKPAPKAAPSSKSKPQKGKAPTPAPAPSSPASPATSTTTRSSTPPAPFMGIATDLLRVAMTYDDDPRATEGPAADLLASIWGLLRLCHQQLPASAKRPQPPLRPIGSDLGALAHAYRLDDHASTAGTLARLANRQGTAPGDLSELLEVVEAARTEARALRGYLEGRIAAVSVEGDGRRFTFRLET